MLNHPMRRTRNEITATADMESVIRSSLVMRLAMCLDNAPYVVPLSFGYDGSSIFFHCAPEGLKLDILGHNSRVCCLFESDARFEAKGDSPCAWGFVYATVIVHGLASRITDPDQKLAALQIITDHYAANAPQVPADRASGVDVWQIRPLAMTGKQAR